MRCKAKVRAAACVTPARSPRSSTAAHKEAQALMLDQQNLLTMIGDERFYSSIVQLKIGETHTGGHRQGRADAPGEEPGRARRPAARRREREDPHPPADPLQGREHLPGREDPGRRRLAHALGRRSHLPAEGPAGVPRARSLGHEPERDQVPRRRPAARRSHDSGARRSRNAPWSPSTRPRAEEPEPVAAEAAAAPAEGAAPAAPARPALRRAPAAAAGAPRPRAKPRRARRRKTPLLPRRRAARSSRPRLASSVRRPLREARPAAAGGVSA